uniref:upstream activation factor subunit spp27-like n=1 Tax=Erigeron canadensis TaxID=72917 RepID=UPI001CB939A3|nr:upstream activation factor subunit spp27-like [Erigeron canadensis]
MLTDSELLEHLHDVLKTSDLDTTTPASVRHKLEQDLGVDLSDRKSFIRKQIDLYLQSHYNPGNGDVENGSENGSENGEGQAQQQDDDKEEEDDNDTQESNTKDNKTATNKKKKGGGFSKPCALSPQLQKLVGEPQMARTEVVKKLWAYIKEKDLQNPQNKRKILCDEMLHEVFRVKSIDMFQMNKALNKHIWSSDEEYARVKPSKKKKQNERDEEDEPETKAKRQKAKGSGFVAPHPISDELMHFFGTDENELSRAEVVKRIWQYIRQNNLQDPSDKRRIICDDKLRELFKVDTFVGFTVTKLLTAHFIKEEKE